jgi:carboxypeptidase C (cathepsin A)
MDQYVQTFKKYLGVKEGIDYIPQNEDVYSSFKEDLMKSYTRDLISVLGNVRVLIYNGQNDYIVNTAGVQNYLNALNWPRINSWKGTKKKVWSID